MSESSKSQKEESSTIIDDFKNVAAQILDASELGLLKVYKITRSRGSCGTPTVDAVEVKKYTKAMSVEYRTNGKNIAVFLAYSIDHDDQFEVGVLKNQMGVFLSKNDAVKTYWEREKKRMQEVIEERMNDINELKDELAKVNSEIAKI